MNQERSATPRSSKKLPYKCAACGQRFETTNKAETHINRKHDGMGIIVWDLKKL